MYDPRQIGAQVWARDRGGDALPPGGTVVAIDSSTDTLLVITGTPIRAQRRGGPAYLLDTQWIKVADLNPDATQPAHGRLPDRTKIARHVLHVLGGRSGPWTQLDLDMLGWVKALTTPPPPTRYREEGYGTIESLDRPDELPDELAAMLHDPMDDAAARLAGYLAEDIEPLEPGAEWPVVLDDRVPPGVAIVGDVAVLTNAAGADALELAKAAAERNGVDPDLVTAGPSGGVVVDLAGLLDASIDAHRARR